jgi:UDP-N-acetylglucosamine--N-acetylmuramyl-(pentapeptide) pyrophosphoryl-undecaprenol N-acetylglucosamine transferase
MTDLRIRITNDETMTDGPVLMIAGGGTGGHIYPAIAVAREWIVRDASRRAVFVGTSRGLETTIVPRAGFPLELISVAGLKGKSPLTLLKNVMKVPLGMIQSARILRRWKPAGVLGVGGYASGPVLLVAALLRYPTAIHEQNAFPGLTNRILAKIVRRVAVAFPEAIGRLGGKGEVTGNPVRREFFERPDASGRPHQERTRLLIFGGSQGSKVLNDAMIAALGRLKPLAGRLEIVHQTGPAMLTEVTARYAASAFADARVVAYLDPMAEELRAADLVVSRAGAMTLGELAATGRPAVLVPFALATNNHQEVNARAMESAGGAVVVTEKELTPDRLAAEIERLVQDPSRLETMGNAAQSLASEGSAAGIVDIIEQIGRI